MAQRAWLANGLSYAMILALLIPLGPHFFPPRTRRVPTNRQVPGLKGGLKPLAPAPDLAMPVPS
jgi:hypothetical protein